MSEMEDTDGKYVFDAVRSGLPEVKCGRDMALPSSTKLRRELELIYSLNL